MSNTISQTVTEALLAARKAGFDEGWQLANRCYAPIHAKATMLIIGALLMGFGIGVAATYFFTL